MKLKAIPYQQGLVFVDESAKCTSCNGDGYTSEHDPSDPHEGGVCSNCPIQVQCEKCWASGHPIIAQHNLNLEGIPYVELEENVEEIAKRINRQRPYPARPNSSLEDEFISGYKAAQPKKYTEEDLRKAFQCGQQWAADLTLNNKDNPTTFPEFIQSLQPKIESIEVETREVEYGHVDDYSKPHGFKQELVTYQKDGKTFLKVKQINYATN